MNRITKKIVIALIGLGSVSGTFLEAHACPGGGGGGGRPYGGYRPAYYPQQRYVQPAPQPYCHEPAYRQPNVGQMAEGYPTGGYAQPSPQVAPRGNPPVGPGGLPPTVRKLASSRPQGISSQALPQGGQINVAPGSGQQLARRPASGQPVGGSASQGGQPAGNPLQALGGSPMQQRQQPMQSNQQRGGMSAPSQQIAQNEQPQQQQQQAPESQPEAASPMDAAQLSALQALGGFESADPQQTDAQQPEAQLEQPQQAGGFDEAQPVQTSSHSGGQPRQPMHVGKWTASLQNGSKVELSLQPNGTFSWVAASGEKVSSFEGNYTVAGGSLTLIRSSDNQKLIGSMTPAGSSRFTFKLTGAKDTGLQFSRS